MTNRYERFASTPAVTTAKLNLLAPLLAIGFGLLLYAIVASQRPQPFTTTVDGIGYFLPLVSTVWNHWLDGTPLRVLWGLGQGWVPWESGQIGYFYPGYLLPAILSRLFEQPLLLLEYSAMFHLGLLGLMAWCFPLRGLSTDRRLLLAMTITASSSSFLIGIDWHNYLTPAPWFVALLGLVFRPLLDGGSWGGKERGLVLIFSALFYTAGHPQMYVLGFVLIGIAAIGVAPSRKGLIVLMQLALLQLPFVIPLAYLYMLAQDATPVWLKVRDEASMLKSSLDAATGLTSILWGKGQPALFNPLAILVIGLAFVRRNWWIMAAQALLLSMMLPTLLPQAAGEILAAGLSTFRWPTKLGIYVLPLTIVLLLALRAPRYLWWAIGASVTLSMANIAFRHDVATALRSAHGIGVSGIMQETRRCLPVLGIEPSSRIAFFGGYPFNEQDNGIPPPMQGMGNNMALMAGLETEHIYEPLEPRRVAEAHGLLSVFWRRSVAPDTLSPTRLRQLRQNGVDYLVTTRTRWLPKDIPYTSCGEKMHAWKVGDGTPFPAGLRENGTMALRVIPGGGVETPIRLPAPPLTNAIRINDTPERWSSLPDGRWRWEPPLPDTHWILATLFSWVICLVGCVGLPRNATGKTGVRWWFRA